MAEAARNLAARPVRTTIRFVLGVVVVAMCVHAQVGARDALVRQWQDQIDGGRFVFTAAPGEGTLDAVDCERLPRRHSDVIAAGAVLAYGSDRSELSDDDQLDVTTITPGLFRMLFPELPPADDGPQPTGGVYVGAEAADQLAVGRGSRLALQDRGVTPVLGALPRSSRLPGLDRGVVEVAVPMSDAARLCYVEARPGTDPTEFGDSVAGTFPRPLRMLVGPLYPRLDLGDENPEHQLARPSVLTVLLGTAVVAAVALVDWFERRRELALYRLLGTPDPSMVGMFVTDFVLASLLPWSIGALIGLTATRTALDHRVVAVGTLLELTVAALALVPVPALAWLTLGRTNPIGTLKAV